MTHVLLRGRHVGALNKFQVWGPNTSVSVFFYFFNLYFLFHNLEFIYPITPCLWDCANSVISQPDVVLKPFYLNFLDYKRRSSKTKIILALVNLVTVDVASSVLKNK